MTPRVFSNAMVSVVGAYAEAIAVLEAEVQALRTTLRDVARKPPEEVVARRAQVVDLARAWSAADADQVVGAAMALREALSALAKVEGK